MTIDVVWFVLLLVAAFILGYLVRAVGPRL